MRLCTVHEVFIHNSLTQITYPSSSKVFTTPSSTNPFSYSTFPVVLYDCYLVSEMLQRNSNGWVKSFKSGSSVVIATNMLLELGNAYDKGDEPHKNDGTDTCT